MNDLPLGNIDWDDPVAIGGVGGRRGLDRRSARNSEAEAAERHSPKLHRPIRATELGLIRTRLKRQPTLVVIRVIITVAGCQQPYRDIRASGRLVRGQALPGSQATREKCNGEDARRASLVRCGELQ